mmetsp:Transcript_20948/g.53234  ORF Transcript_20948/g.53234 Transcript_20948/m.53234 type:complete len:229 (+) Transcript_20948:588-1274(+)
MQVAVGLRARLAQRGPGCRQRARAQQVLVLAVWREQHLVGPGRAQPAVPVARGGGPGTATAAQAWQGRQAGAVWMQGMAASGQQRLPPLVLQLATKVLARSALLPVGRREVAGQWPGPVWRHLHSAAPLLPPVQRLVLQAQRAPQLQLQQQLVRRRGWQRDMEPPTTTTTMRMRTRPGTPPHTWQLRCSTRRRVRRGALARRRGHWPVATPTTTAASRSGCRSALCRA